MQKGGIPRKLPDMGILPEPENYEPPPKHICHVEVTPIDVTDELKIQCVQHIYKGLVVHFAIMLYFDNGAEDLPQVSRIDTCHGRVHRHRFDERRGEVGDPDVIHRILLDGSEWQVVNSHYDQSLDKMFNEAEEYFRRWKR